MKIASFPLPVIQSEEGLIHKYCGVFNGFSVAVKDVSEMKNLCTNGVFGKANLSRGYPNYGGTETVCVFNRTFEERKKWEKKSSTKPINAIVVPDFIDNLDYFKELKVEIQSNRCCIKERLELSFQEAFFLFKFIDCLDIYYNNIILTEEEIWKLFVECDKNFVVDYAVYHYFRSKNWVVKSGLKYGGDYLLYKEGPRQYHAKYLVIIDVVDQDTLRRIEYSRRSMDVVNVLGINRVCEHSSKDLLICQLVWPRDLEIKKVEDITKLSITEILMKRWIPSQNKNIKK